MEGSEDRVLAGMRQILFRDRPAIVLECNPDGTLKEIEAILGPLGYSYFHLTDSGVVKMPSIIADPFERFRNYL